MLTAKSEDAKTLITDATELENLLAVDMQIFKLMIFDVTINTPNLPRPGEDKGTKDANIQSALDKINKGLLPGGIAVIEYKHNGGKDNEGSYLIGYEEFNKVRMAIKELGMTNLEVLIEIDMGTARSKFASFDYPYNYRNSSRGLAVL